MWTSPSPAAAAVAAMAAATVIMNAILPTLNPLQTPKDGNGQTSQAAKVMQTVPRKK
jgi:hypothetical protein